jgi:Spy/CpxP family protein refolding chaperone
VIAVTHFQRKETTMIKARLLACACALGLIAAPAFAASGNDTTTQEHPWRNPSHGANHTGHAWRQTDTSQDAAVDRLNDQSLEAAHQNRPFGVGGGAGGGMSGSPATN